MSLNCIIYYLGDYLVYYIDPELYLGGKEVFTTRGKVSVRE